MTGHAFDPNNDSDKTLDHQTCVQMNPSWSCPQGGVPTQTFRIVTEPRKFANPSPLGLSAFAVTTFVLSCVNMHVRGETAPHIAVSLAFGYGGLVQLLAGMWYASYNAVHLL